MSRLGRVYVRGGGDLGDVGVSIRTKLRFTVTGLKGIRAGLVRDHDITRLWSYRYRSLSRSDRDVKLRRWSGLARV